MILARSLLLTKLQREESDPSDSLFQQLKLKEKDEKGWPLLFFIREVLCNEWEFGSIELMHVL